MSKIRLTNTSYIVLGLLDGIGEATPYDLKRVVGLGLGDFWSLQHAQLYREPKRLTAAGYLSERSEAGGRRRRHYTITAQGRGALREWLAEPTEQLTEPRVLSMLKLLLGADPERLAERQLPARRDRLAEYEELLSQLDPSIPVSVRLALEAGIEHEREWVRFWGGLMNAGRAPRRSRAEALPQSSHPRLTPTSYIVLSLLEDAGEATPYELKTAVAGWDLWSLQHAQLYAEPERLAKAGYLRERREEGGRHRKLYTLTTKGRSALREWIAEPTDELDELRDLALLKLFFGVDPARLAKAQLPVCREKLAECEQLLATLGPRAPASSRLALEAEIGHLRVRLRFWGRFAPMPASS